MENAAWQKKILIVDDNPTNLRVIQEVLKDHYKLFATLSGEKALAFLEKTMPDLILLDIEMPGLSGYDVIERIKRSPRWKGIPVIFLTAQEDPDSQEKAFRMGAIDYIIKPISPQVVLSRVGNHLELEDYRKNLEQMVEEKTRKLEKTQDAILDILSSVTAFRDSETGGHIMRTTLYVKLLLDNLIALNHPDYRITSTYASHIIKCAKLHDIGKVAISDNILLKPGKLSEEEYEAMKAHTLFGSEMIDNAMHDLGDESSFLYVAKEIVLYHHEKWDGSGYPLNVRGADIPVSARVMSIADVYDALISKRPYKTPFTHQEAVEIISRDAGHFDPTLLELSKKVFDQFEFVGSICNDEKYPVYSSETLKKLLRQTSGLDWAS